MSQEDAQLGVDEAIKQDSSASRHGYLSVNRIFILSPAQTSGKRALMAMNPQAQFSMAQKLREPAGVPIGELFSFFSSLYFRGKLTYANRFANPPAGVENCYVITSTRGLVAPHFAVTAAIIREFTDVPIDLTDDRYRLALHRSASQLRSELGADFQIVLLGSIATDKYSAVLSECFGEHLAFPSDFLGRGDMSRGGLMLRAVAAGKELEYLPLSAAESRRGKRPPKLGPK
jgi:hypothetical protein